MATIMQLEVVSAESSLFSGEVLEVFAPGEMGDLGIMPRHTQLITTLKAGELRYVTEEGDASLFVAGGVMEVQPHVVTVLADTAIRAKDLDAEAAEAAKQRAEDALQGKDPQDLNYEAIQAELDAAKAQIEMIHRIGRTLR
ncbi:MAG: F0F1 ATP synthase subunit epsilon [Cocleimonas sp.]|nr:F0F1 ATP synthase subunit epsilon [Cocleimonas sp.]